MNIQNTLLISVGLALLVAAMVWINIRNDNKTDVAKRVIRSFLFALIVVLIVVYFLFDDVDDAIDNMIKTPPDF
jgi:glucan phosphoethanolaminetransferase (alkaline phosphatase superfamily)